MDIEQTSLSEKILNFDILMHLVMVVFEGMLNLAEHFHIASIDHDKNIRMTIF
jgi:hypothetical protein